MAESRFELSGGWKDAIFFAGFEPFVPRTVAAPAR
jgi:hypothetical protein